MPLAYLMILTSSVLRKAKYLERFHKTVIGGGFIMLMSKKGQS